MATPRSYFTEAPIAEPILAITMATERITPPTGSL